MQIFQGKSVVGGVVIGEIVCIENNDTWDEYQQVDNEGELQRFYNAQKQAILENEELYQKALLEASEEEALIFETHKMMLEDQDFVDMVVEKITHSCGAFQAIIDTREYFYNLFSNMDDEYMKARSADILDICNQMLEFLTQKRIAMIEHPCIVVAKDLTPSQTLKMKRENFLALITQDGSSSSHTAILARTMGIPAINQIAFSKEFHGKIAIVDADRGEIILSPTQEVLQKYQTLIRQSCDLKQELQKFRGRPTITKNGKKIKLYANIGSVEDAKIALENDAEGIGLFRSEFLYLQSHTYPTEEEQFQAYKNVLETMGAKRVIVRTLDIGADKKIDYFNLDYEENPALGYRAIRICLKEPEVFKTQLRALYRASFYGRLAIMFPMIISLKEVKQIKQIIEEVKDELKSEGKAYSSSVELGVMIETPASVMIAQELAKEVDFFSVGSNDLAQYTLAIDRQNPKLEHYLDEELDIALMRMFEWVIEKAHHAGIWVGICGELASQKHYIHHLLQLGFDELSISPKQILEIRKEILDFK